MLKSWQTPVGLSLLAPGMFDRLGDTKMSQQIQSVCRLRAASVNCPDGLRMFDRMGDTKMYQ
jgi:hypothetical protein